MLRWLAAACLVLSVAASASAQTAQVTGTLVDEQGAAVPGASVQLAGPSGRSFATTTVGGAYTFQDVAAGTYQVTATIVGFAAATAGNVAAGGNATVTVPALTLKIASLTDTVVVSATKTQTALVEIGRASCRERV